LVWLTLVVALTVAWRVDRMRWQDDWNKAHTTLIEQFMELRGKPPLENQEPGWIGPTRQSKSA
jgi:hypothetical protein